jgi:hypothetical protein
VRTQQVQCGQLQNVDVEGELNVPARVRVDELVVVGVVTQIKAVLLA